MLEESDVIAGTMKDAMHVNRLSFDDVKGEVVLNNQVSVSEASKLFLVGNASQAGISRKQSKFLFNESGQRLCCRRSIRSNVGYDFREIVFGNPQ